MISKISVLFLALLFLCKAESNVKLSARTYTYNFWTNFFTKRDRDRFVRHLKNADRYEKLVKKILKEEGVPEDIFYLGLVESGYNNKVRSRASAVGPWQFMKATARYYGLRVDKYVDERMNIVKSTKAAARYLKDLHNIFHSWELAFCAYNAGEYRLIRGIRKGNTRDYWKLYKKRLLPRETANYIAKIKAARNIFTNRDRYGLPRFRTNKFPVKVSNISINSSVNVRKLARSFGMSYHKLKEFNPDLKRGWIRVSSKNPLEIVVPFSSGLARDYSVQRGDNLSLIAKKYGTTVSRLKDINDLSSNRIYVGQRLKLPKKLHTYIVRQGDNLTEIAKKFDSTIKAIMEYNSLASAIIYPRQKIYIPI